MAESEKPSVPEEEEQPINSWMVRPCSLYNEEYKDCKSIRGRFQQYFVDGKFEDCSSWSQDYINCEKWKNEKNMKALNEIIKNEEVRREKRLSAHFGNNVWENRREPPGNWNAPLPLWLEKRYENSFLKLKSQEINDKGETSLCVIL